MIVAGILTPFEDALAAVLEFLHESIGLSWAWSIVGLTVMVRMLLVPLTVKQIHSMQRLQRHAPRMKEIQQKYKHDKPRQREEMLRFYQENKINPASSCLPLLAQAPVFFALFFVLRDFEDEILPRFPGADLGWLDVVPNITENAGSHWSGYLLLAIYAISQTASTFFMSATMDRFQRGLLLALPLVFLFVVINFPAGLILYWMTSNLWTVGQGLVTRRLAPKGMAAAAEIARRSSRTPPREAPADVAAATGTPARTTTNAAAVTASPRRVKRKKKKVRR